MILRPPAPPAINDTVCLPEWDWSVGFSDPRCTNPDTRFGASMAFGDFNGDGQTDLAVGAPGAVEVLLPLFEGPDPVTDPPPVEVLSPFWNLARTALLPRPLEGEFVDDTRFGFALAIGRFDESGERAYRDLAIGAPGGVPTTSSATAGLVEIVEGGVLEGTAGWPVAPVDVGALGAAQVAQSVPPLFIEWDISNHSVPEPGDEFGYALFAADLVRTTLSELGGQWMDELVIGVPGEDLAVDVLSGPVIADAGAVCVHVFSDGPLVGIAAPTPGRYGDVAPGFVDASTRCVGLLGTTQTDMVPLGCSSLPSTNCPGSGLKPGARLGSSVAASRLSPWDPDVQVAAGAPGRPSSDPPVAEGRVHVFHFVSVYGDQVELADGTSGSRVRYDQLEPWGGGTSPGTSLGAAMALAPDPCGEVPDLLVSGSNSGSEIGRTRMKPNSRLDADMSGRYERNMSGGESATVWLALLVDPANPGAQFGEGYAFTASVTNYSPALTFDFEAFSACTPLPWNWLALPGGMPVWQVSTDDCVEGLAAEQAFYSPDGFDWGGFAWPAHNRLDDWSGPQILVDLDLEDLTRLPELITAAGGTVGVEFELVSPVRYVSLCPDLTLAAGGEDLSEALLLDGDKVNGCPEAEIEFTRGPEGELDCNRRWDLQ